VESVGLCEVFMLVTCDLIQEFPMGSTASNQRCVRIDLFTISVFFQTTYLCGVCVGLCDFCGACRFVIWSLYVGNL
jgi:hypothetical protein